MVCGCCRQKKNEQKKKSGSSEGNTYSPALLCQIIHGFKWFHGFDSSELKLTKRMVESILLGFNATWFAASELKLLLEKKH